MRIERTKTSEKKVTNFISREDLANDCLFEDQTLTPIMNQINHDKNNCLIKYIISPVRVPFVQCRHSSNVKQLKSKY